MCFVHLVMAAEGLVRAECVKYGQIVSVTYRQNPWDFFEGGWTLVVYAAPEMASAAVQRISKKVGLFGASKRKLACRLATEEDFKAARPLSDTLGVATGSDVKIDTTGLPLVHDVAKHIDERGREEDRAFDEANHGASSSRRERDGYIQNIRKIQKLPKLQNMNCAIYINNQIQI